ncbi:dual specificity phosphatase 16 [Labeo rohita]|uniref:Dual specificity phosphatase 16 n=1 Tax=Labeo rohita TaxID=84645 RepID=A0A498LIH5_LABRO|nr:dual specificity phosphatase 16 [Labeo rohita]RXN27236.1 dual specificity phosphatase 16 [Labeo rohita]
MCEHTARPIGAEGLVALLEGGLDRVLLIDSRPFVEYNTCHILEAVNVNCSKLMKRRLQQDKIQISELLQHSAKRKLELQGQEVVVYDQSSSDPASLSSEAFLGVLLAKLEKSFPSVHLLSGGFVAFSHLFPGLCEGKSTLVPSCISQPCLPVSSSGPTRILPHLYLGCQRDVLNKELMQQNDIAYVLNASNTCPKPDFIPDSHFLRVPVNDSFCEKILPWLDRSVEFIEKAKASNARVLVHCLAGISRSATIAIAYIMKRMDMSLDEAYRFVKEKRPTISPNFNFLGQLLDFEKKLKSTSDAPLKPRPPSDEQKPEPLTMPCVLAGVPEEHLLARALCGLQLGKEPEDNVRPKRSFSLDIKSYGESGAPLRAFPVSTDGKPCQFSPVQEVSEQSPAEDHANKTLQRSGSVDGAPAGVPSRSQHPSKAAAGTLKGWHSDIVLGPVAGGWFLSSESARFYSTSAIFSGGGGAQYGCSQGLEAVRRRGRQRSGDGGDSRRSWHEESSFEKQLKRRSCQMDGMTDSRSREEIGKRSSQFELDSVLLGHTNEGGETLCTLDILYLTIEIKARHYR